MRAWMLVSMRNLLVVDVSELSVENRLIRPLQLAVYLCVSLLLLVPALTYTGVFQSCIMSNAASNSEAEVDCPASSDLKC